MVDTSKRLKISNFKLTGHDPVYGYPAPVIPVGEIAPEQAEAVKAAPETVAVYPGGEDGPSAETIDPESSYVRYPASLQRTLETFDPLTERLFAFTDEEVQRYRVDREHDVFAGILRDCGDLTANREVYDMMVARVQELETATS